jgi:hypothetical protein
MSLPWDTAINVKPEPPLPDDPKEAECVKAGGHAYVLAVNEGSASLRCEKCDLDPVDGYSESINLEGIPVTLDIETIHYPANPNHADEWDVFHHLAVDVSRLPKGDE